MFFTLESVRAALKLGPVMYRCNVCGGTHNTKLGCPTRCLEGRMRSAFGAAESVAAFRPAGLAFVELIDELRPTAYEPRTEMAAMFIEAYCYDLFCVLAAMYDPIDDQRLSGWNASRAYFVLICSFMQRGDDLIWMLMANSNDANREILHLTYTYLARDAQRLVPDHLIFGMCAVKIKGPGYHPYVPTERLYRALLSELDSLAAKGAP